MISLRQISIHSKIVIYSLIGIVLSSDLKGQQNNSFDFQSDGTNGDFVTVSSNTLIQPNESMTLEAWVKPTEDPSDNSSIVSYLRLASEDEESGFAFIYNSGKWRFVVITEGDFNVMPQLA